MRQDLALLAVLLALTSSTAPADGGAASARSDVVLGRLPTGARVAFTPLSPAGWGIAVAGGPSPRVVSERPVRFDVFGSDDEIRELVSGYGTIARSGTGVEARAEVAVADGVALQVLDRWRMDGAVVSVSRAVTVAGRAPAGFASSIVLALDPAVGWRDVQFMAPGALYGDPTHDGERSAGGTLNDAAHRFVMREDVLPAPLFALSFGNGASIAVLDPSPRGDTTVEESTLARTAMTDARFQFGALGARQGATGPVEFGFWFPGSVTSYGGRDQPASPRQVRRYHPIEPGIVHRYEVAFRFGRDESFRELTRNAWRWAWDTLKPAAAHVELDLVRRVLTDHLVAQAATIDGRTAIPFVLSTVTDRLQWNWTMAAMGFVGKNIECADQLLREGDRDPTERGRRMRETGLAVIASMIQALPTVPLPATGYDLATGKPHDHVWLAPWLRNASEDMRVLLRAYRRERALGREHPEWLAWVKNYADWLLQQQREDGSFPRRWKPASNEPEEPSGTTSYAPVPLLVLMSDETGDPRYAQAAARAAEFVWARWGRRGLFVGGASDNPDITDKEAGMLSLEAFLSLYEASSEPRWLERAKAAADFAESWTWIWNLPMPLDADDSQLHWKKGVATVGLQGITALGAGGTDEYLAWSAPSYAKLYKHTKDEHYLEVARVLLHDTKAMLALPGRTYDLKGPGWQQENWRLGPGPNGRGVGGHRFWLPWVSANHLYGITGLEEDDPLLYKRLAERPAATSDVRK